MKIYFLYFFSIIFMISCDNAITRKVLRDNEVIHKVTVDGVTIFDDTIIVEISGLSEIATDEGAGEDYTEISVETYRADGLPITGIKINLTVTYVVGGTGSFTRTGQDVSFVFKDAIRAADFSISYNGKTYNWSDTFHYGYRDYIYFAHNGYFYEN